MSVHSSGDLLFPEINSLIIGNTETIYETFGICYDY